MRTGRYGTGLEGISQIEQDESLAESTRQLSLPLYNASDLDPLMDRIGEARFVLLGEASHGTAEFYHWRARLSRRLIAEKGFSFIAVEGDWPDCYRVNRYVKSYDGAGASAREVLHDFERWPTWMWANEEIVELAEWLRSHNERMAPDDQVGFYGLDVYSLWESLDSVMGYLQQHDPGAMEEARRAYHCFEPYGGDAQEYARATRLVPVSCQEEVVALLGRVRAGVREFESDGLEAAFCAEQNALVVKNAEAYYRAMVRGGPSSWNVRDRHMVETLERLMRLHGPQARAIVWEHNTHIGDARATDMADAGMVNVGQLVRERRSEDGVVLVGFSSHHGTVIAGDEWGAPMRRMKTPPARPGSWEDIFHTTGSDDKLLLFDDAARSAGFNLTRGHRAIGVVYHPEFERFGNYVPTALSDRYDAMLYLDETQALRPLHLVAEDNREPPDTYPFAV